MSRVAIRFCVLALSSIFCGDAIRIMKNTISHELQNSRHLGGDHAIHVQAATQWLTSKGYSVKPTTPVAITGQRNAGVTLLKTEQGETFVVKSVAAVVHGQPNNEIADLQRVIEFVTSVGYEDKLEADPELPILTLPLILQEDYYIMKAAQGKAVQNIIDDQSREAFGKPRDPACGSAISAVKAALTKLNDLGIYHHDALTSNVYYDDASGRVTLIDLPDIKGPTGSPYSDVDRFTDSCETYLRTRKGKTATKAEECGGYRSGATMTCIGQNVASKPECRGRGGVAKHTPSVVANGIQRHAAQPVASAKTQADVLGQKQNGDPCASLRSTYPTIEYDPTSGRCVIRQQAPQPQPDSAKDPCAGLRRQYPNVRWNGKNCVI